MPASTKSLVSSLAVALLASVGATGSSSKAKHGAVVSEVAECSDIGVQTLKEGGSAADAVCAYRGSSPTLSNALNR